MNGNSLESVKIIIDELEQNKDLILNQWIAYSEPKEILTFHNIDTSLFKDYYGSGVFDYFMAVIKGEKKLGDCPVMSQFLAYLKDRDISANELFTICSHFRKSMIDFSYDAQVNSKSFFDDISYVFDENFSGVLKLYTDTIYQKEQEIAKNVELLNEYKKALDESAIVSKTDIDGKIIYANENFCQICGYSVDELLGQPHSIVRHPDVPESFFEQMWQTLHAREMFKGTIKNRKKEGSSYYLDITIVPIIDPVKGVTEFIAIGYEVTKLINARQEALEAGQAKESFLSSMSHEIRTPLNAILGFVSILLEEDHNPRHSHYLSIINNSGKNLLGIINDILDFSKLRSGVFSVEKKVFNPHEEFSHVLELFSQSAYAKNILIRSFIDPKIPYELIADPLRIKQVFSNLMSNAIKFTPEGGEVEVVVEYNGSNLSIVVRDSGKGIDESEQEKIFDAFEQAKHTQGGTGLGLSISKQLVEHMGGAISYENSDLTGSCFTFTLPVNKPDTVAEFPFDPVPFQRLRIAILCESVEQEERFKYLRRYFDSFGLNTFCIRNFDEDEYDILLFIDENMTPEMREELKLLDVASIALLSSPDDKYENIANITPLVYPIYCEKMYHVFLEALELTPNDDESFVQQKKQRRFNGHVLVAEDNIANQELIKIILERYGLSYYIASDGLEAVQTFKVASFDLVFMDEQMPRKDGLEATHEILEYERVQHKKHTPIIGLSANVIEGAKERALSFGCDAFLGKPIVIREFEAVLDQYLEEAKAVNKPVSHEKFNASRVDMQALKKELMLDDEEITLLLQTFVSKMKKSLPILAEAIEKRDYSKISLEAHSIKGSAANFRFSRVEGLSAEIESSARGKSEGFDYKSALEELENIVSEMMG